MPSRKSALRWHATPEVEAQHIHTVEQAEALAALPSATAVEVSAVHNKCASRKRAQVHDGLFELLELRVLPVTGVAFSLLCCVIRIWIGLWHQHGG